MTDRYAGLYERHAINNPPNTSIGGGDYDAIGAVELQILIEAGLTPTSTLLDFGCGTGRLAVHAIPYLAAGSYVGTDISPTMLDHARRLGGRFVLQPDERFPAVDPDLICAYSVFTHMEHEDTYRYLRSALDIVKPSTVFVASVLELTLPEGQQVFLDSAQHTVDDRWTMVRNVVTSESLFTTVAGLAGWTVTNWSRADVPACTMPDGSPMGIGQSVVTMRT